MPRPSGRSSPWWPCSIPRWTTWSRTPKGHKAPFPVLADAGGEVYESWGVEHSVAGVLKSVVRLPAMLRAMRMGYVPSTIQGRLDTLPADFLVDRNGRIAVARYARDAGDRMPLEQIAAFARTT
jgi:peroxiredoxin Q/BCP